MSAGVPPGYKQTEVGVIPEDWGVEPLGCHCDPVTKGTTPTSIGKSFKASGIKFIKAETISESGKMLPSKLAFIDLPTHNLLARSQLSSGDLLVSIAGVLGRVGIIEEADLPANINQALAIVRLGRGSKVQRSYLICQLRSPSVKKQISDINVQAAQANISLQNVRDLQIPLPPTKLEQQAIAEALSDADALIEGLGRLIAKKRQLKQGALRKLLSPREGWSECCIGDVLTVMHGKSQREVEDRNGIYPILATGGQIGNANRFLYDRPSVLIGRKGTIDRPQYMDRPFWTVDTLFYSVVHEPNNAKYLYYQFRLIDWKQHNEASGVPSLNARTIENIELKVPSSAEQTAIAAILSDMDTEISALEVKLTKARQVKEGMMQDLLTGKVRLV